jgi:ring-1,2-phenylacetyl-CoA epoxidase subunit PaaC
VERSGDTVIGLGDGTEQSHARMQAALDKLWPYVAEMFDRATPWMPRWQWPGAPDKPEDLRAPVMDRMQAVLTEATLIVPETRYAQLGGKTGARIRSIWATC